MLNIHSKSLAMCKQSKSQKGISLIESLVAIVVMALGILGILGVQMRTLADTQTAVSRAQAIRLIENLSEQIRSNPDGLGNLGAYTSPWGAASAPTTCGSSGCNAAEMAARDIYLWKQTVANTLPLGNANVFLSSADTAAGNRRQLGVMIGWRENEREREGDSASDTIQYKAAFIPASTASTNAANVSCPAGLICHLQYIQPNQRCMPFPLGAENGVIPLYCPN